MHLEVTSSVIELPGPPLPWSLHGVQANQYKGEHLSDIEGKVLGTVESLQPGKSKIKSRLSPLTMCGSGG